MVEDNKCTAYVMTDDYSAEELEKTPESEMCKCPKCGRGIPPDFPENTQFKCSHCNTILEAIPEFNEDSEEEYPEHDEWNHPGKICIVPDYAIKTE